MKTVARNEVPSHLYELAVEARSVATNAYNKYSGFYVGAAVLTSDGQILRGTFFENASGPAGVCAERVAIGAAVTTGTTKFKAIAIVGGEKRDATGSPTLPCGVCRQVMTEFGPIEIVCADMALTNFLVTTSSDLLPLPFERG